MKKKIRFGTVWTRTNGSAVENGGREADDEDNNSTLHFPFRHRVCKKQLCKRKKKENASEQDLQYYYYYFCYLPKTRNSVKNSCLRGGKLSVELNETNAVNVIIILLCGASADIVQLSCI